MSRLEIGQVIKTSYQTGPYRIKSISRGCKCAIEWLDDREEEPEHIHLVLTNADDPKDRDEYYLGWYDEDTLRNVRHPDDRIIIVPTGELIQATLF